jgi:LPS-assembly lipoprotein
MPAKAPIHRNPQANALKMLTKWAFSGNGQGAGANANKKIANDKTANIKTVNAKMQRRAVLGASLASSALLAGCGWRLRGDARVPFKTLYVGFASSSLLGNELKRNLRAASSTELVEDPAQAEAILQNLGETRDKRVLSVNSAGRPREYMLVSSVAIRVYDNKGQEFMPATTISLTRDISFNDSQVLSKEAEENQLYREMQTDLVQQILRRLGAIKR